MRTSFIALALSLALSAAAAPQSSHNEVRNFGGNFGNQNGGGRNNNNNGGGNNNQNAGGNNNQNAGGVGLIFSPELSATKLPNFRLRVLTTVLRLPGTTLTTVPQPPGTMPTVVVPLGATALTLATTARIPSSPSVSSGGSWYLAMLMEYQPWTPRSLLLGLQMMVKMSLLQVRKV
jgi:hypothetical protein